MNLKVGVNTGGREKGNGSKEGKRGWGEKSVLCSGAKISACENRESLSIWKEGYRSREVGAIESGRMGGR